MFVDFGIFMSKRNESKWARGRRKNSKSKTVIAILYLRKFNPDTNLVVIIDGKPWKNIINFQCKICRYYIGFRMVPQNTPFVLRVFFFFVFWTHSPRRMLNNVGKLSAFKWNGEQWFHFFLVTKQKKKLWMMMVH